MLTANVSQCKIYLYTNKFWIGRDFTAVTYCRPKELGAALDWLSSHTGHVAAGCTDLFAGTDRPALSGPILDVTAIDGLRGVHVSDNGWRIGATTTWTDIIRADLPPSFNALKSAAREVGSMQIQNAGTIAGNLCNASPAADGAPCLLALDATVELVSAAGSRTMALSDFITGPSQTALRSNEMMTAIHVSRDSGRGRSHFSKLGARKYLVISIAMVAARVAVNDGTIVQAAVSVGACSAVAVRLAEVEAALVGQSVQADTLSAISDTMVTVALAPIDDIRSDADYRLTAAAELVRRTLRPLLTEDHEAAA